MNPILTPVDEARALMNDNHRMQRQLRRINRRIRRAAQHQRTGFTYSTFNPVSQAIVQALREAGYTVDKDRHNSDDVLRQHYLIISWD